MFAMMLLMLVGGVGLTQAVSDPKKVTLQWLRLGGLIATALVAVSVAIVVMTRDEIPLTHVIMIATAVALPCVTQLIAVQLGKRTIQRVASLLTFLVVSALLVWFVWMQLAAWELDMGFGEEEANMVKLPRWVYLAVALTVPVSCGIVGGFLMTMMLGHAYLTAGSEMTQAPFMRLVILIGLLLLIRAALSIGFGLMPYLTPWDMSQNVPTNRMWTVLMMTARYAVGIVVPGVFVYMIYDCVKRRSNQSATGIIYVAGVLVLVGEGVALALLDTTKLAF